MARAAGAERRHSFVWLQGLACGAVVTLAPATALLLAVLLAPGGLALVLDSQPGRPTARTVLLCSAAAVVEPVRALWAAGHTADAALALLGDLGVIGTAWSAAAAGWLLVELAPIGARIVLEAQGRARSARLRAARARVAAEWGADGPDQP
jgi:hypothetical protein